MISSLKSHREMLFSIELEVSICFRPIGTCSVKMWLSSGVQWKCGYRMVYQKNALLWGLRKLVLCCYFAIWVSFNVVSTSSFKVTLLFSCCCHPLPVIWWSSFSRDQGSRFDALVLIILDRILAMESFFLLTFLT